MSWTVLFTRAAQKDARRLVSASPALKSKAQALLELLAVDPYQNPRGACSRRINIHHRLVVQVLDQERIVKVLRMWSHYD